MTVPGLSYTSEFIVDKPLPKVLIAYGLDVNNHKEIKTVKILENKTEFKSDGLHSFYSAIHYDSDHGLRLKFIVKITPTEVTYYTRLIDKPTWHINSAGGKVTFQKIDKKKTRVIIHTWTNLNYRRAFIFPRRRLRLGSGIKTAFADGMLQCTHSQLIRDTKEILRRPIPKHIKLQDLLNDIPKETKKRVGR